MLSSHTFQGVTPYFWEQVEQMHYLVLLQLVAWRFLDRYFARYQLPWSTRQTPRGLHVNCLQPHVNYLNTAGSSQVILCSEIVQIYPRLGCKIACFCTQKYMQFAGENTRTIAGKNTRNCTQNYLQLQAICYHTAGKFTCKLHVSWLASCKWSYPQLACFITCYHMYSAWGACRVETGKFTCFYRKTACNAGKLRVGFFTCFFL